MGAVVRLANEADRPSIERLLRQAKVHADGVDKREGLFFVVEERTEDRPHMIGTAGVEFHGHRALLRSVVLESKREHARIALEVIRIVLAYVQASETVDELYLFTLGPVSFFEQLGFQSIRWSELPRELSGSPHVRQTVRDATPMVRRIPLEPT